MYRSQKNLEPATIDYKALYLEQKRMKEQFQRRAHVAELKFRKLAQNVNKKCIRCLQEEEKLSKNQRIWQLKQFKQGLIQKKDQTSGGLSVIPPNNISKSKLIQNFAIFGVPQSMLVDPDETIHNQEGELLFISDIPSDSAMHSAKLAFPSGVSSQYYSGMQAKQKSIEIMSSNCSYIKTFVMSFQGEENLEISHVNANDAKMLMNPENRLYAICLAVQDFTLVPAIDPLLIQSQKIVKISQQYSEKSLQKAVSCKETEATFQNQNDNHIVISQRVYCIFSKYPLFQFFQSFLKSLVSNAKTERLVMYRESGCSIAEADSHFFLSRVKENYRELANQFQNWEMKMNREYEIKLISCQKLCLKLEPQICQDHFIQEWGLPILSQFSLDTFLDVFILILLEEKVVFVCQNPFILTFTIHLFTRLLPKPFKYPYPSVSLLPDKQEYFNAPFPVVYGYLNSKKNVMAKNLHQDYRNVYVCLDKNGVQIISADSKKHILKKRPKILQDNLSKKFRSFADTNRRTSILTFTDDQTNFRRDKDGICQQIVKTVNNFLTSQILNKLPSQKQLEALKKQIESTEKKKHGDINQKIYEKILKSPTFTKGKDEFFQALFQTQLINVYLFKQ